MKKPSQAVKGSSSKTAREQSAKVPTPDSSRAGDETALVQYVLLKVLTLNHTRFYLSEKNIILLAAAFRTAPLSLECVRNHLMVLSMRDPELVIGKDHEWRITEAGLAYVDSLEREGAVPEPLEDVEHPITVRITARDNPTILCETKLSRADWVKVMAGYARHEAETYDVLPGCFECLMVGKALNIHGFLSPDDRQRLTAAVAKKEQGDVRMMEVAYIKDALQRQLTRDLVKSPMLELEDAATRAVAVINLLITQLLAEFNGESGVVMSKSMLQGMHSLAIDAARDLHNAWRPAFEFAAGREPKALAA